MTVKVADAYAHIQKLVSVVKMATLLEDFITEEQRSVVRFFVRKGIFINKYFLFTTENVYDVKRFTAGSRNGAKVSLLSKRLKRRYGNG
jgi:hypothetical protein